MKTREGSLLLLSSWPCSFFCSPLAWSYPLSERLGGTGYTSALGARFSKGPETFRARKAIFSLSVSKNREVCTPETPCMKGTSVHIKNMWIKQLCNHKVWDFAAAFRVRKFFGNFEKRALGRVVRKPVNCANPGLKVNRSIHFSCLKVFFTAYVRLLIPAQNCRTKNINRKPHRKVTNMKSKFLLILD